MNHCRDCNSDYEKPGTCNCFAPGGKRCAAPAYVPWYPYSPWWVQPYYPSYPYYGGKISVGDFPGTGTTTITISNADLPTTGSSVSIESAMLNSVGSFTAGGNC